MQPEAPTPMSVTPSAEVDPIRLIPVRAWVAIAIVAGLIAVAWRVPLVWMYDRWTAEESFYTHGFLVPPVVLWLAYNDRFQLYARRARGSLLGLGMMLAGLGILFLSGMLGVYFTAMFGLIPTLWGMCGFLFGWAVLRRLTFPALMIAFMVPLPLATIAGISLKLKLLATALALHLLNGAGVLAINDGSTILLENGGSVIIGNACSGLSSMISLIFLGVLFAWMSPLTPQRKVLLFLSSMPIAMVANVVRVFGLCLVANAFGSEAIAGAVHDISGYMIFVVAFLLLYTTFRMLAWRQRPAARAAAAPEAEKEQAHA